MARCQLFCDEWQQASHGGELTGAVLPGAAPGRSGPEAVTLFDSTGLAIQDLALCLALLEAHRSGRARAGEVRL